MDRCDAFAVGILSTAQTPAPGYFMTATGCEGNHSLSALVQLSSYIIQTVAELSELSMLSKTAADKPNITATQVISRRAGKFATQKIWLPKLLYDCLPYFYLTAGFAAFFATVYISDWFWVLPHYLLFSAACLHLAFAVYKRRKPRT